MLEPRPSHIVGGGLGEGEGGFPGNRQAVLFRLSLTCHLGHTGGIPLSLGFSLKFSLAAACRTVCSGSRLFFPLHVIQGPCVFIWKTVAST